MYSVTQADQWKNHYPQQMLQKILQNTGIAWIQISQKKNAYVFCITEIYGPNTDI